MSYTREQRAANAAKAAASASQSADPASAPSEPAAEQPESIAHSRPAPRNEARSSAMDEISARHERTSGNVDPTETPTPAAPAEPKPEPVVEAPKPDEPVVPVAEPVIEMVKVKIDGVESEVPKADVDAEGGITAYQKSKAADNRLEKANKIAAENRQIQAQLAQFIQQQVKPAAPTVTDDQFITSKMDTIRFGTPEESAAAMREVIARANPRIDANQITQNVMREVSKNSAAENFKKEFGDIISNPILLDAAASMENKFSAQAAQNPQTDWNNFYRSIGNQIRSAFGRQSQPSVSAVTPAATDTPSPVSDKEARKSSIVNLPTASARATPPAEPKPETREEALNNMRKARGLPTQ